MGEGMTADFWEEHKERLCLTYEFKLCNRGKDLFKRFLELQKPVVNES